MESNVGSLRRRLNKAVRECRSQASCTVRSLAGQILTMDRRVRRRRARMQEAQAKPKTFSYSFKRTNEQHHDDDDDAEASAMHAAARAEFFCQYVYVLNNHQPQEEEQQQQVEKFLSEDDYEHPHNNYHSFNRQQQALKSSQPSTDAIVDDPASPDYQRHPQEEAMSPTRQQPTTRPANQEQPTSGARMRVKLPTSSSLKTNHYFIRCSTSNTSTRLRGSSRRRRQLQANSRATASPNTSSSRVVRQVRFQPIPQQIDISIVETNDSTLDTSRNSPTDMKSTSSGSSKFKKAHLSAKPLIKRLHNLSHIKFNRIKLKGFNSLKQQLNQTLNTKYSCSGSSESTQDKDLRPSTDQVDKKTNLQDDDDDDWGSDFDDESLDSSLTNGDTRANTICTSNNNSNNNNNKSYLLEIGKASSDQRAIADVIQDQGMRGQFKRIESSPQGLKHELLVNEPPENSPTASASNQQLNSSLEHVVESSHHTSAELLNTPPSAPPYNVSTDHQTNQKDDVCVGGDALTEEDELKEKWLQEEVGKEVEEEQEEEGEEEEELRSLEARQGFRQIRDKLQVILDQRLAHFERSVSSGSVGCQLMESPISGGEGRPSSEEHATGAGSGGAASGSGSPGKTAGGNKQVVVEVAEDWQSHCSDESGLESNHSGSQDSGHSTQHSGYSTHSCHLSHHPHHPSPDEANFGREQQRSSPRQQPQTDNKYPSRVPLALAHDATTAGTPDRPLVDSCRANLCNTPDGRQRLPGEEEEEEEDNCQTGGPAVAMTTRDNSKEERRSRFLQNRLIINSKLESIFQRTSGNPLPAPPQPDQMQRNSQMLGSCSNLNTILSHSCRGGTLDSAMRSKLLEQQRQMSLKLKQKPRRKSVKRLTPTECPQTSMESVMNNQQVDVAHNNNNNNASSYAAQQPHDTSGPTRDTLTKQLSMICLRQAADQLKLRTHQQPQMPCQAALPAAGHHQSSGNLLPGAGFASTTMHMQRTCQPAMSLRQLVKNVIDDCEKPSQLTKSILDRSSSLSSELGTSADELNSCALTALPARRL